MPKTKRVSDKRVSAQLDQIQQVLEDTWTVLDAAFTLLERITKSLEVIASPPKIVSAPPPAFTYTLSNPTPETVTGTPPKVENGFVSPLNVSTCTPPNITGRAPIQGPPEPPPNLYPSGEPFRTI